MLHSSLLWLVNVCLFGMLTLCLFFQKLHQGKVILSQNYFKKWIHCILVPLIFNIFCVFFLFIIRINCLCVYHQHNNVQHHNLTRKSRRPEKESHDWYQKHEFVPPILDLRIRLPTKRRACRLFRDLYPLYYWRIASLYWSVTFSEIRQKMSTTMDIELFCIIRWLDGRGPFLTILISLGWRALYYNIL